MTRSSACSVRKARGQLPGSGCRPMRHRREVRVALLDTAARWQRRAENPLTQQKVSDAARVLVRTCEGVLLLMDESA